MTKNLPCATRFLIIFEPWLGSLMSKTEALFLKCARCGFADNEIGGDKDAPPPCRHGSRTLLRQTGHPEDRRRRHSRRASVVRTPGDVEVLERPPWWTPMRLMTVVCVLLLAVIAFVIWNRRLPRTSPPGGHVSAQAARARAGSQWLTPALSAGRRSPPRPRAWPGHPRFRSATACRSGTS